MSRIDRAYAEALPSDLNELSVLVSTVGDLRKLDNHSDHHMLVLVRIFAR